MFSPLARIERTCARRRRTGLLLPTSVILAVIAISEAQGGALIRHEAGLERSGGALARELELKEPGLMRDTAERSLVGKSRLLA